MTKIGLAGDWHGNTRWAVSVLDFFAKNGISVVYQVGDFGLWPGADGKAYLDAVRKVCEENGQRLWITPGNHEDYDQIENVEGEIQNLGGGPRFTWEVALLPRGFAWEEGGLKFCSLGGAPSVDRLSRKPGRSWWEGERITLEDVRRLEGVEADVMLTHDSGNACTPAVAAIIDVPPHKAPWPEITLIEAAEGRKMLDLAIELVKPKLLVHGHYHVYDLAIGRGEPEEGGMVVLSLDMDGLRTNVAVLDTETLFSDLAGQLGSSDSSDADAEA